MAENRPAPPLASPFNTQQSAVMSREIDGQYVRDILIGGNIVGTGGNRINKLAPLQTQSFGST